MQHVRDERRHRATRRTHQRQHMRVPRDQHNLSVFVLKETQPGDLQDIKLPAYEEINAHQVCNLDFTKNSFTFGKQNIVPFLSKKTFRLKSKVLIRCFLFIPKEPDF